MGLIKTIQRQERLCRVLINNLLSAALNPSGFAVPCSLGEQVGEEGIEKRKSTLCGAGVAVGSWLSLGAAVVSAVCAQRAEVREDVDPAPSMASNTSTNMSD